MTRLLLDSHAFFWFVVGDSRLSVTACESIQDTGNDIYVSAITAWEITNKVRLGKWPGAQALANDLASVISELSFETLPLSLEHARYAGTLRNRHRDPFDRMLAAQAEIDDILLVTADPAFRDFKVKILW